MDHQEQTEEQGFIGEAKGPNGVFAVFEDDGETGYLYIYEPEGAGIIQHLHIYHRSKLPTAIERQTFPSIGTETSARFQSKARNRGTIESLR